MASSQIFLAAPLVWGALDALTASSFLSLDQVHLGGLKNGSFQLGQLELSHAPFAAAAVGARSAQATTAIRSFFFIYPSR